MRGLTALVAVLSVLLVLGGAAVMATLVMRGGGTHGPVVLDEPVGTRIAGVAGVRGGLAVVLQGGGLPDRVVVVAGAPVRLAR